MKALSGLAAPVASALALAAFAAVFAAELRGFGRSVEEWARRDLRSRAALAASTLKTPLATSDFRAIHAFGDRCTAEGVRLVVRSAAGGVFFDTARRGEQIPASIAQTAPCGDFAISLSIPLERVLAPYALARRGFVFAALAGACAVLFAFFASYRQIAKMRELARLERFRRDFTADISHEIKTPLAGILGAADLLHDAAPGEREKLLDMLSRECKRLDALAQGVLDLARLENAPRSAVADFAECDLAAIAEEAVEAMRPLAGGHGCEIRFSPPPDGASAAVRGDPDLLHRAVSCLVENAIRHSGSPEVSVSVAVAPRKASIAVEDHGCGVPPELAEKIFERFRRADPAREGKGGGAGLGLAIARRIARLHGGDIAFVPAVPHGARFTLSLPRPPSA